MAQVDGVFEDFLQKGVTDSKILVVGVGARGIGCELLKNLLLTGNDSSFELNKTCKFILAGFKDIEVIDWGKSK